MKILDASENLTEEYIRELSYLIHGSDPIIRDYTATEEHLEQVKKAKDEGRLPIFTLSPEMFRKRTPEEKEALKREAQKRGAGAIGRCMISWTSRSWRTGTGR